MRGNDQDGSAWKYVPVRRLALYIEASLYEGTQWVAFEPNNEQLWRRVTLRNVDVAESKMLLGHPATWQAA